MNTLKFAEGQVRVVEVVRLKFLVSPYGSGLHGFTFKLLCKCYTTCFAHRQGLETIGAPALFKIASSS